MADKSLFNESFVVRDSAQQKRKKARARISMEAEFQLDGKPDRFACQLVDIGTGGLSIQTKSTLYVGDKIVVSFKLKQQIMKQAAVVTRVAGKSVGAQFTNLAEADLGEIQEYIHSSYFDPNKDKKN